MTAKALSPSARPLHFLELGLRHGAPFAQDTNRVLASSQPIDDRFRHHDLATCRNLFTRVAHDASYTDIFIGKELDEPLVLAPGKDSEFLAASGLDELNLSHDFLLHRQHQAVTHIRHPEVPERSEGLEGRRPPKLAVADFGARYADLGHARDLVADHPSRLPRLKWPRSHLRMTAMGRFLSPTSPVGSSAMTADRDISVKLNIAYCDNWRRQ
jgi:hypothetical protein